MRLGSRSTGAAEADAEGSKNLPLPLREGAGGGGRTSAVAPPPPPPPARGGEILSILPFFHSSSSAFTPRHKTVEARMTDAINAFVPGPRITIDGAPHGPLARPYLRGEGPVRRRRPSDRRRQPRLGAHASGADAARLGGADAARCRRDADRQDHHRRGLPGYPGRERVRRHAAQHPRAGSRAGRLLVRLRRGGGRRSVRHRAWHRHRRLGARAGELLRPLRHSADAWAPRPHRHAAAGAEFRHHRLVRPRRRDLRARLQRAAGRADPRLRCRPG